MAIRFDAEFDAIFSNQAIHWIQTQRLLYKKMNKVLKPRGRILLSTLGDPAESSNSEENGDSSAGINVSAIEAAALITVSHTPELEQFFQVLNSTSQILNGVSNMHERKPLTQKMLEGANFTRIQFETRDFFVRYETLDAFFSSRQAYIWPAILHVIPENIRATTLSKIKAQIKKQVTGDTQGAKFVERYPVLFISAEKIV